MACGATLKRTFDFDHLHTVVSTSPGHTPIVTRTPPSKRRRVSPRCAFTRNECRMSAASQPRSPLSSSPFQPVLPLASEMILKNIFDEYKRMKRRRQLYQPGQTTSADLGATPCVSSAQASASASSSQTSTSGLPDKKLANTPMFTMKQVSLICERLLKEQEDKLRSEYDQVLVNKLSEQYDAFVKFNYDQIQRQLNENPASYVS